VGQVIGIDLEHQIEENEALAAQIQCDDCSTPNPHPAPARNQPAPKLSAQPSNAPGSAEGQQDFIKGWPARYMLERAEFVTALGASHAEALKEIGSCLNYGTAEVS
jgi:hypothetical protein